MTQTLNDRWPPLPYEAWKDTYATLHMWAQIIGKVALSVAPRLNHSWAVALHVTPRGLSTRRLAHNDRSFTMEFDFIDHVLVIRASDGPVGTVRLEPKTVADFYAEVMSRLREMGLGVTIWSMPVEIPAPIRFEQDTIHRSYDPVFANRHWRILSVIDEVFTQDRCAFVGKCSPTHFFWGSFDLAVTRFSGKLAPPRDGPAFMRDAYSHEVISHGFWPGSAPVLEPAFYAYAVPEAAGFRDAKVQPDAAYYQRELNLFLLPYEAVRVADSPETAVHAFIRSTYELAADLGKWDRPALERAAIVEAPS